MHFNGGGHIVAVEQPGVESRIDHISTGGGACIDFSAGEILPGTEALSLFEYTML